MLKIYQTAEDVRHQPTWIDYDAGDGLVNRTVYLTKPLRVEYELTDLGSTLLEPATTLFNWVQKNYASVEQSRRVYDEKMTDDQ